MWLIEKVQINKDKFYQSEKRKDLATEQININCRRTSVYSFPLKKQNRIRDIGKNLKTRTRLLWRAKGTMFARRYS